MPAGPPDVLEVALALDSLCGVVDAVDEIVETVSALKEKGLLGVFLADQEGRELEEKEEEEQENRVYELLDKDLHILSQKGEKYQPYCEEIFELKIRDDEIEKMVRKLDTELVKMGQTIYNISSLIKDKENELKEIYMSRNQGYNSVLNEGQYVILTMQDDSKIKVHINEELSKYVHNRNIRVDIPRNVFLYVYDIINRGEKTRSFCDSTSDYTSPSHNQQPRFVSYASQSSSPSQSLSSYHSCSTLLSHDTSPLTIRTSGIPHLSHYQSNTSPNSPTSNSTKCHGFSSIDSPVSTITLKTRYVKQLFVGRKNEIFKTFNTIGLIDLLIELIAVVLIHGLDESESKFDSPPIESSYIVTNRSRRELFITKLITNVSKHCDIFFSSSLRYFISASKVACEIFTQNHPSNMREILEAIDIAYYIRMRNLCQKFVVPYDEKAGSWCALYSDVTFRTIIQEIGKTYFNDKIKIVGEKYVNIGVESLVDNSIVESLQLLAPYVEYLDLSNFRNNNVEIVTYFGSFCVNAKHVDLSHTYISCKMFEFLVNELNNLTTLIVIDTGIEEEVFKKLLRIKPYISIVVT